MRKEMVFLVFLMIIIPFVSADTSPLNLDVQGGLVSYWNFNGGSTYLDDFAPNGVKADNAIKHGSTTIASGRIGENALKLNGNTDYLEIADSADISPTNGISLGGWFKVDNLGTNGKDITGSYISKRDSYILGPANDGKISLFLYLEKV